jgi:hypothetical protein
MSDDEREFEELRRRLADEGQAHAPADLAGDVMRQVRAEPRRRPRRSLRPALVPLAAALLAAAALVGVSHLGGSASSGSAGSAAANGGQYVAPVPSTVTHGAGTAEKRLINGIPHSAALQVLGPLPARCPAHPEFYAAAVPSAVYDSLQTQLQNSAAIATPGTPLINVQLRHAPKAQTQIRITCP